MTWRVLEPPPPSGQVATHALAADAAADREANPDPLPFAEPMLQLAVQLQYVRVVTPVLYVPPVAGLAVKLALTVLAAVIVTVQTLAAFVESQPVQLPKVCVLLAVGMILTTVSSSNVPVQLTTVPVVLPVRHSMLPPLPAVAVSL